jgi:hypothetical protein
MISATSRHLQAAHGGVGAPPHDRPDGPSDKRTGSCDCHAAIAAFESVPGPRRKRAASDEDIVECLDPGNPETQPATMVQRTPV